MDYAENYAFTVREAIPGFHWNNGQATVYNVVVYYTEGELKKHRSLVVISDCMHHDAVSVHTFQKLIIKFLTEEFTAVKKYFTFVMVHRNSLRTTKMLLIWYTMKSISILLLSGIFFRQLMEKDHAMGWVQQSSEQQLEKVYNRR